MGGDNYRRLVPRGSYIDVNNFKSIKGGISDFLTHVELPKSKKGCVT